MKALHGADLRERFVGAGHRVGDAVLHAGARPAQATSEHDRHGHDDRDHGERRRRESRVREREQHDPANQEQHLARHLRDPRAQQGLQDGEVGRQTARQLTGATIGEEPGRQSHEMREDVLTQPRDDTLGRRREQIHLHEVHRALQREQTDESERDTIEQRTVVSLKRRVEQRPHDLRKR
jgi:hypothetical protein